MIASWIKPVFVLSALYDGVLGIAFLFFAEAIFRYFGVTPPNHPSYVQFSALLLLVFAAMYYQISRDPPANRSLIPYGIGLKVSYCVVVFWHYFAGSIPSMWLPFAWTDLVFLVFFVLAWNGLAARPQNA